MIDLGQSVLIGIVEGLTEFLPVSSTAHMEVVPQLLHLVKPSTAFEAVIQLGPTLAIIIYLWRDIVHYLRGIVRTKTPFNIPPEDVEARLGWYTVLGSIPILIVGKLLEHTIETKFHTLSVIGMSLIGFGLLLWLAELVSKRNRGMEQINAVDTLIIGVAQCFSLCPGASRSGVTMTAAMFRNIDREAATRFSFLLSLPAITAAGLYKFYKDFMKSPDMKAEILPYLVGTIVAGVVAYLVVHWFLGYVKKHSTSWFIVYRIVLGIALLVLLRTGYLKEEAPEAKPLTPAAQTSAPRAPQSNALNFMQAPGSAVRKQDLLPATAGL